MYPFIFGDYPQSDRCLRTSSLFTVQSVHLTLPHEFRGRSDRECQDLRLGRLGVPRPARIAARLTLCPRDLPGLRIRLTTVPCILLERLESTWCHQDLPADQADHSPLISPVCGSGRLRDARDLSRELTDMTGVQIGGIFKGFWVFFYLIMTFSYFISVSWYSCIYIFTYWFSYTSTVISRFLHAYLNTLYWNIDKPSI